jgi:hypothetical protein
MTRTTNSRTGLTHNRPYPAAEALAAEGRLPDGRWAPSPEQLAYVEALRSRLRLPKALLDNHCVATFGSPFADLDRRQASALIDQLKDWEAIPADLERERGQLDLF